MDGSFCSQKLLAQCDTTLWVGGALGGDLIQAPLQTRLIQERSGCSGKRWKCPRMQIPQPLDWRDLPPCRPEQSTDGFWPPQLRVARAPQRSSAGTAGESQHGITARGTGHTQLSTDAKAGISAVHFPYILVCPEIRCCFRAWRLNMSSKRCHPAGWAARSAATLLKEEVPTLC